MGRFELGVLPSDGNREGVFHYAIVTITYERIDVVACHMAMMRCCAMDDGVRKIKEDK